MVPGLDDAVEKRRRHHHSAGEWEALKHDVLSHYIGKSKSVGEVVDLLEREHNFEVR